MRAGMCICACACAGACSRPLVPALEVSPAPRRRTRPRACRRSRSEAGRAAGRGRPAPIHALHVRCMCVACALRVRCVRVACALRVHCVCASCALRACGVPWPLLHDDGHPRRVPVRRVGDLDRISQLRPAWLRLLRAATRRAAEEERAHRRGEALEEALQPRGRARRGGRRLLLLDGDEAVACERGEARAELAAHLRRRVAPIRAAAKDDQQRRRLP